MSKRNVAYVKPKDPSFLQKLKAQIGYREGPTVNTKRQRLEDLDLDLDESVSIGGRSEREEKEEENPQVVVLKAGDLTAEEADAEKKRIRKEEEEKPADLSQRIIFRPKAKSVDPLAPSAQKEGNTSQKSKKDNKDKVSKSKLSFNDEEDEDF